MSPSFSHWLSARSACKRFGLAVFAAGFVCLFPLKGWASCSQTGSTLTCTNTTSVATASDFNGSQLSTAETASPYPSTIAVSGVSGTISSVQVVLNNVNATVTNQDAMFNTEIVLVGPNSGQTLVLAGGPGASACEPGGSGCVSGANLTIADGNNPMPSNGTTTLATGTYEPSSYILPAGFGTSIPANFNNNPSGSISISTSSFPQSDGTAKFSTTFSGSPNGTWSLYMVDWYGDQVSITGGWTLIINLISADATTTSLSTGTNPAAAPNNVTYTATVENNATQSPATTGTVTFTANGSTIACVQGSSIAVNSSGVATCTITLSDGGSSCSSSTQPKFPTVCQGGANAIQAIYSGNGSTIAGSDSNTVTQWIGAPSSDITHSGNQYCNTQPFYVPTSTNAYAYPSYIPVSGFSSSTVLGVSVQLQGISSTDGITGQFLLVAPSGQNLDFLDNGFAHSATASMNLNFDDTAGQKPDGGTPTNGSSWEAYALTDNTFTQASGLPTSTPPIPQVPGTITYPPANSNNEFSATFNGATANGNWALYVTNEDGAEATTLGNGWCITLTPNPGTGSTTTVTANPIPALVNQTVTYTATVTSGGSPVTSGGTVTFLDNGNNPGGTAEQISLGSGDTASFSSSSLYDQITLSSSTVKVFEGDHTISADYSGSSTDDPSFGSVLERINNPTTFSAGSGGSVNACNTGPIYSGQGNQGAFTPNPSIITVSGVPGTVQAVMLTLENFNTFAAGEVNNLESLVEGPTGAALDFFSGTGGSNPGALTEGNYVFADSAGSSVPAGSFSPGSYKPTSYLGSDTYTSGFYKAPSSFTYAAPFGSSTFASTFEGTNPSGNWALFFNMKAAEDSAGAVNGWCLNFVENAVGVAVNESHSGAGVSGDFVQGQSGGQLTTTVTNDGPGATGDPTGTNPLTVVDTLNSALTYTGFNGTGWSCSASGQTITCTNDSSIAQGSAYPTLTLNVSVSQVAPSPITNSVNVSGAGITNNTASDAITVDAAPVLSIAKSHSGNFVRGSTAQWTLVVTNIAASGATSGQVTVLDTLPTGYTLNAFTSTSSLWTCSGSNAVTCTASPGITAGNSSTITVTVNVPIDSPTSVSNVASVYGGGDLHHTGPASASQSNTDVATVPAITPTFTWTPPSTIIFGTAGTNVLNATISCMACGTISYTATPNGGSATAITTTSGLAAGTYTITANFTSNTGGFNSTSTTQPLTVSGESVWVVNSSGGTAELAGNGYAITSNADPGANGAAAIDATGNVWTIGSGSVLLEGVSQTGTVQHSIANGGGLDAPSAIAADGDSQLWITNAGNNSISLFLNNGTAASPSTGFTDSSLSNPSGIAVDQGGSVWIANQGNNSVTRILGAAAPAAPLSTAAANHTTGAKP